MEVVSQLLLVYDDGGDVQRVILKLAHISNANPRH
jgi:hypothetical protein